MLDMENEKASLEPKQALLTRNFKANTFQHFVKMRLFSSFLWSLTSTQIVIYILSSRLHKRGND